MMKNSRVKFFMKIKMLEYNCFDSIVAQYVNKSQVRLDLWAKNTGLVFIQFEVHTHALLLYRGFRCFFSSFLEIQVLFFPESYVYLLKTITKP